MLDYLSNIKGFFEPFLAIQMQIHYYSCRLIDNKSLLLAGLVGGGPTFVGTVLGSLWTSTITSVFFLSIAGGALIYVSMLMYNSGRKQTTNDVRHFRRAMCRFCYRSNSYTWRSMTCIVQVNKQSIKELV
ncbi:MAG: hypothetical protein WAM14_26120 [Candidatus Nitrosopolaris sp.]